MNYVLKDHIGSLYATVTDGEVEYYSFDAWGRERNHNTLQYDNINTTFDRGFCMHEHYRDFGLINMNGRMYDPLVGRMLSPDIVIQNPEYSQSYNRYTYCFNNPLRFTDPSGYVVRGDTIILNNSPIIRESIEFDKNKPIWFFNSFNTDETTGTNTENMFLNKLYRITKEAAKYYFYDINSALDFMNKNTFVNNDEPYKEISAWIVENGVIVQPWIDNDRYTSVNKRNINMTYKYKGVDYKIFGQIHTHPNFNDGDIGVSDEDIDLNNKITNAYIIWNNDLYKVPTNKNIQPLKIRNINDTTYDFYKLFKDNYNKRR